MHQTGSALRVLITPLNWGLGHATRCLPIADALIRAAEAMGETLEVHWASDGDALAVLRRERPADVHHELPGADVRYPTRSMALNMLLAAPALTAMMLAEARAVARLHRGHGFGLIVSDNRFGCRVPGVRSLIITHQVHLPLKPAPSRVVADVINHGLLRRFDGVLVPDYAEPPRLAGPMSAPLSGVPVRYVGPVSRLGPGSGRPSVAEARAGAMPDGPPGAASVVCLLSGPEPTRTSFEGALISNLPAALDAALGGVSTASRWCGVRGPRAPPPWRRPKVFTPPGGQSRIYSQAKAWDGFWRKPTSSSAAPGTPPSWTSPPWVARRCTCRPRVNPSRSGSGRA